MWIQHHVLHGAQALDAGVLDGGRLHMVRARGRGNRLQVPAGWTTACVVLAGVLDLHAHDTDWSLPRMRYEVWMDGALHCASHGNAWWLALAGPTGAWVTGPGAGGVDLLPWDAACPRTVLRPLVRLARRPQPSALAPSDVAGVVEDFRQAVIEHQQGLYAHLQRCSGRTRLRRQQTLLRLLRVQHLIRCHLDDHMALARLADSANYSPCHLIRVYRSVFGETPNGYAARLRFQQAWELVCATRMPVCEIAATLGFESESAFCRAFKQAFGCTTGGARRQRAASRPRQGARLPDPG